MIPSKYFNASFSFLNENLASLPPQGEGGDVLSASQLLSCRDTLLSNLPVPLIISDEQNRILYVNRALLSLLNCSDEFPLGKDVSTFLIPQAQLDEPDSADATGAGGRDDAGEQPPELILMGAEGKTLPVQQISSSVVWNSRKLNISVLFDLTEQRAANERLLRIAYYDSLTGLPNRDSFMDSLNQEIHRLSDTEGYTFSVMLLNMDRFKLLNEQFGADIADKVLVEVTERIKTILHGFATIFRTGGDEIAAILKGVSSRSYLESTFERLLKLIAIPVWINGDSVFPSACITSMLDIPRNFTALQVLGRLSGAMKVSKKRGMGCLLFVPPVSEDAEANASHRDILKITAEIQASLVNEDFIPYFQPIYNTSTMQLLGFETLARWRHPDSGVLPPSAFISEAEESGLMTAIDKTIVAQSLAAMETFTKRHPELNFFISANACGLSLKDPSFFDFIREELGKVSFPPERFVLEITEDILMENLAEARQQLESLKKLNIRVALDDFGTGYSSLQYIGQLPVDNLKIDRSFINQLLKSQKTMSLVKSIIEMARSLNLTVVAEGIETKDQNQWLADFNVNGQGFFFSTPLSMEKTEEFLKDASAFATLFGGDTAHDA